MRELERIADSDKSSDKTHDIALRHLFQPSTWNGEDISFSQIY